MGYKVEEIEGIGPSYATKLATAKIETTDDLLARCADRKGRKASSETTGISERQLLKWADMADLMRVSGVARQYSELLKAAGVDTIKELRNRSPAHLAAKMKEVNEQKKLAHTTPAQSVVEGWVKQAKALDPMIRY